ncbi:MAG: hypothetical protein ABI550_08490 [Ignavibacteriaceae bacterium]
MRQTIYKNIMPIILLLFTFIGCFKKDEESNKEATKKQETQNTITQETPNTITPEPKTDENKIKNNSKVTEDTVKKVTKVNKPKVGNPRDVNNFPEDYVDQMLVFKNIRYWPTLQKMADYYTIQIDIANSGQEREWGFVTMSTIIGVVEKDIAKKMSKDEVGGYNKFYFGTITGRVIKSKEIFGSDYIFIITKIINHPQDDPSDVRAEY